jgi:hypothetical protein
MKLRHAADLRAILLTLLFLKWTGTCRNTWTYLATFPLAFLTTLISRLIA